MFWSSASMLAWSRRDSAGRRARANEPTTAATARRKRARGEANCIDVKGLRRAWRRVAPLSRARQPRMRPLPGTQSARTRRRASCRRLPPSAWSRPHRIGARLTERMHAWIPSSSARPSPRQTAARSTCSPTVRQSPRPGRRRHRHRQDRVADGAGRRLLAPGRAGVHGRRERRRRRPGACAGTPNDKLQAARRRSSASTATRPKPIPVVFWDLYGKLGHPVRTTISEIGPDAARAHPGTERHPVRACSRSPSSSPTTTAGCCSTWTTCARCSTYVADNAQGHLARSTAWSARQSVGGDPARAAAAWSSEGGERFFGEPALELADLHAHDIGRPRHHQRPRRRPADPEAAAVFELPALAAVGAVREPARSRRSRQAQAGVLLRRGAPAVRRLRRPRCSSASSRWCA